VRIERGLTMNTRKKSQKGTTKIAQKQNTKENVAEDIILEIKAEILNEIAELKDKIQGLQSRIDDQDNEIRKLKDEKKSLISELSSQQSQSSDCLKSVDLLDRKLAKMQGGFRISGNFFHEEVNDSEDRHFLGKFKDKMVELAKSDHLKC